MKINTQEELVEYINICKVNEINVLRKDFYVGTTFVNAQVKVVLEEISDEWPWPTDWQFECNADVFDENCKVFDIIPWASECTGNELSIDKDFVSQVPTLSKALAEAIKEKYSELVEWLPTAKNMLEWYTIESS